MSKDIFTVPGKVYVVTLSRVTDAGGVLVLGSSQEAERAGITREGKLGSIGLRIGRRAGESVMDALRNGLVDDRVALWIADFCPGNDVVQRRGLEAALRDAGKAEVLARMEAELARRQMQEEMGLDGGMDLFGNALDNDAFMDFVAQYVVRRRNELAQDASYLNATAKKRNAEAMGKKYGVDVKDPAALKRKLEEIDALRERWKNPYSDSGLMDEIRAAWRGREGGEVPAGAIAGRVEAPSEKLFREYAAGAWRTEGVDFSVSPTLREDLAAAYEHRLKASAIMPLCTAPRAFSSLGLPMLDIVTTPKIIGKVKNKHHMNPDEVEEAVRGMDDPLLIIREDVGRIILFPGGVTWSKNGKGDIVAPVRLELSEEKTHFLTTLYGLDSLQKTEALLRRGFLLYSKYGKAELAASNAPGLLCA